MISYTKKLFQHSSSYLLGQILLMAAGFLSFPIYTRALTISDYGHLGLVTSTIAFVVAISKLGLQHSIIRFYPEFHSLRDPRSISVYYSTFFISNIFISASVSLFFFFSLKLIPNYDRFKFKEIIGNDRYPSTI